MAEVDPLAGLSRALVVLAGAEPGAAGALAHVAAMAEALATTASTWAALPAVEVEDLDEATAAVLDALSDVALSALVALWAVGGTDPLTTLAGRGVYRARARLRSERRRGLPDRRRPNPLPQWRQDGGTPS